MIIDETTLTKLEKLSMLKIADDKREEVKSQLENIVSFVENLSELDGQLKDVRFPFVDKSLHFRADEVRSDASVSQSILSHAPKAHEGFFIVPKIIE